jgi:hypothetical protein
MAALINRRKIWRLAVLVTAILILAFPFFPEDYAHPILVFSAIAAVWALVFHLHARHAQESGSFKELFVNFNERYDLLNERLTRALHREGAFTTDDTQAFVDYFNLCSEEWLFFSAGYIHPTVWRAWENGMRQYGSDPRVAELWRQESKTDSYYGLKFPIGHLATATH